MGIPFSRRALLVAVTGIVIISLYFWVVRPRFSHSAPVQEDSQQQHSSRESTSSGLGSGSGSQESYIPNLDERSQQEQQQQQKKYSDDSDQEYEIIIDNEGSGNAQGETEVAQEGAHTQTSEGDTTRSTECTEGTEGIQGTVGNNQGTTTHQAIK